jgi:hypothetical protein
LISAASSDHQVTGIARSAVSLILTSIPVAAIVFALIAAGRYGSYWLDQAVYSGPVVQPGALVSEIVGKVTGHPERYESVYGDPCYDWWWGRACLPIVIKAGHTNRHEESAVSGALRIIQNICRYTDELEIGSASKDVAFQASVAKAKLGCEGGQRIWPAITYLIVERD